MLKDAFYERRSRNSSYSLRAFARDLGVPSSNLSLVLKHKKGINSSTAIQISERLNFSDHEKKLFCKLVEKEHARSEIARLKATQELEKKHLLHSTLDSEAIKVIEHWYYYALIELLRLDFISQKPEVLAKALELSEPEVTEAVSRLEKFGMIVKKAGRYRPAHQYNWSTDDIPSETIRRGHSNMLEKAKTALSFQTVKERDFTSMMFGMDQNDIPEAKKIIREFIKSFTDRFSVKKSANRVYALNLQLFNCSTGITNDGGSGND